MLLTPPVKQQVMSKMERGQKEPSASQMFQISKHLGVPISFFFEDLEAPKPATTADMVGDSRLSDVATSSIAMNIKSGT